MSGFVDLLKVIISSGLFLKASYHDLKEREVPDSIWILMIALGLILDTVQYLLYRYDLIFALIQFVVVFGLASFMFYVAGFGGADSKALISLAVMFPVYPRFYNFPLLNTGIGIFAFSVLSNSVIVAPFIAMLFFIRNLKERDGKLLYRFIGFRVDADRIPKFYNLLEYVDENWNVVRVTRGVEPDENMIERLRDAKRRGILDRVWVTPALPFLVFMTAGFLVAVFLGDVLVWLIWNMLR